MIRATAIGVAGGFLALLLISSLPIMVVAQNNSRWRPFPPSRRSVTGILTDGRLAEASSIYVSELNPGLFWTMGDSGNPPLLLAIDSSGRVRATLRVEGARNIDWESLGHTHCGEQECILIGDTGDNTGRREVVTIYRVIEPKVSRTSDSITAHATALTLQYPDGPHNVEAIAALPDGRLLLISKGNLGAIVAYRVAAAAWRRGSATAQVFDTLPIEPRPAIGRLVSGAAFSPDGKHLAVRTYGQVYLFDRDPTSDRLTPYRWAVCGILGLEPQGEGIAWARTGQSDWRLILISERGPLPNGTMAAVDCTPPKDDS